MPWFELEYNITHPYPRSRLFTISTLIFIVLLLPCLVIVNIITVGYELVPSLQQDFQKSNHAPWWTSNRLPKIMRGKLPVCQPKDIGRGDTFRVSPALFEYKVLSTWHKNTSKLGPEDEGRVEYRGAPFNACRVPAINLHYNILEKTHTHTVFVECPKYPVRASLETRVVFAIDPTKDHVGKYYGYARDLFDFVNKASSDYRKAVFAVFDVISSDSLGVFEGEHLGAKVLSLNIDATMPKNPRSEIFFGGITITYVDGTESWYENNTLGEAEIYRAAISNTMLVIQNAVLLDLGNTDNNNIFVNPAAVDRLYPNGVPGTIDPSTWVGTEWPSFDYGAVVPPYQSFAEMLRAGLPSNITLGGLTGLPSNSTMVTSYLCPSYQLKTTGSLLASVFVGTATMFLSAWSAWIFASGIVARQMRRPCIQCTCDYSLTDLEEEKWDVATTCSSDGCVGEKR